MPIDKSKVRIIGKFVAALKNPYLYGNEKTLFSVDSQVCPFMIKGPGKKHGDSVYSSRSCPGCYSAKLLNIYGQVRAKIESAPKRNLKNLSEFIRDLNLIKMRFPEIKKVRFYALSDFSSKDMPFILAASRIFTVDIISKTLAFPKNQKYLEQLINAPNIWISLSFNQKMKKNLERIHPIIQEANNVQLNYCLNVDKEDASTLGDFQVLHFQNKKKLSAAQRAGVSLSRVCGILDLNGELCEKGTCVSCDFCHVAYKDSIETPAIAL